MSHVADGDLHAHLDEALDTYAPAEAERIRGHLESCADCSRRLEEERAMRERAGQILGDADPGSMPLASLEELEARAGATAGSSDHVSKSVFSWRRPSVIGMGWAATIALALWTGYSVRDFAPNPVARTPAAAAPARELEAVVADEQPTVAGREAVRFNDSPVEAEAVELSSEEDVVGGGGALAGVLAEGVASADRDQTVAARGERRAEAPAAVPTDQLEGFRLRRQRADVASQLRMLEDAPADEAHWVSGTVTDAKSGVPLEGAQIVLSGTDRGALTNKDGLFTMSGVPAGSYEVRAVFLGFAQEAQNITIGEDQTAVADFKLSSSAVEIDGIAVDVVTSEARRIRELVTTADQITVDDVPAETIANLDDVLSARTEGPVLYGLRGLIGTGQKVRIHGKNSISLSSEPLVFVDGVQYYAAIATAGGLADPSTSRLDDLNPNDIANIEVMKGPEATELFGAEAANGVLLITTTSGLVSVADLEVDRVDVVELPGMGSHTLVLQVLPNGEELQLWSIRSDVLANELPSVEAGEHIESVTTYLEKSLPRGWSMTVRERQGGYVIGRAPLPRAELDALMAQVPDSR